MPIIEKFNLGYLKNAKKKKIVREHDKGMTKPSSKHHKSITKA